MHAEFGSGPAVQLRCSSTVAAKRVACDAHVRLFCRETDTSPIHSPNRKSSSHIRACSTCSCGPGIPHAQAGSLSEHVLECTSRAAAPARAAAKQCAAAQWYSQCSGGGKSARSRSHRTISHTNGLHSLGQPALMTCRRQYPQQLT